MPPNNEEQQQSDDDQEDDEQDASNLFFFPEHEKYKQKIANSQKLANAKKKRSQLCWRGYRTAIKPGEKEFDEETLNSMLITALKNIKKISSEEQEVIAFLM